MSYLVQMRLRATEGALVRILGVLRRRGYDVLRLSANRTEEGKFMDVVMVVESLRSGESLAGQVAKLLEVEHVRVYDVAPASAAMALASPNPASLPTRK